MTIRKGLPAKLALTDADDTRYLFSGLFVCNSDGSPRSGVLSPVGTNLVTATATMNVSVNRFHGTGVRDGGNILLANDGAANVLLDAAPGANSRIDVVYAKQNDASATVTVPDGDNTPVLTFVKGTAGAVPVKPALPVGAVELATVLIPSGATATNSGGVIITQTAAFTAAAGGVVTFRTKTALDLWTTAQKDQQTVVLADSSRWRWSGSAWASLGASGWTTWATAPTGITVGAGGSASLMQRYKDFGDNILLFQYKYVLGTSGASVGTNPSINLPFSIRRPTTRIGQLTGSGSLYDASAASQEWTGNPRLLVLTDNAVALAVFNGSYAAITATSPWTWAAGDEIGGEFWAEKV